MIRLSNDLQRHVPQDRVDFLTRLRDQRAARLSEAKTAAESKDLSAWKEESTALVAALSHSLNGDEARIVSFEALIPGLEAAARAELTARAVRDNALRAHGFGSADRATALRLRDDLEAAESARSFAWRTLEERKREALALLPSSGSIEAPPGADVVEALASYVINKRYDPEYAVIHKDAKARWLAADDVMWWPLQAQRLVKSAPREWEDARRVKVALPRADFYLEFAALKAARQAHHLAKVRQAQTIIENARLAPRWGEPGATFGMTDATWGGGK
jgi:hypothetical protein